MHLPAARRTLLASLVSVALPADIQATERPLLVMKEGVVVKRAR